MTDNEIIGQIINSFSNFNLRDIIEINNHEKLEFTIAEFILCSCFIDQLSGFRYNTDKVGKRYRQFVKDYLPNYNSTELYEDLRNKLVHNYSVGSFYGLTRKAAHLHLQNVNGVTHLNLENFISDLKAALDKYILELTKDSDIRRNALCWFSEYKIIGLTSQT
jgi:hypothetical protein